MTQAEYAAGNFKQKVAEGGMTARVRVGAGVDNVAGVKLPVFSKYDTGVQADNQSLGLVGGGKKIVAVREKFTIMLEMLIKYVCRIYKFIFVLIELNGLALTFFSLRFTPSDWLRCRPVLPLWMKLSKLQIVV